MKIYERLKKNGFVKVLFVTFFVFQFVQIFQFDFFVQSDDFGYIANTAFFAGYNWNPYTGNMTQYFNIGFPITGAFAFHLFDDVTWIYRCLLVVIIIWQCALMYLIYRLSYEFFEMTKNQAGVITFLFSIGTMGPQNGLYYMAEIPFTLFFLLSLYLLLRAGCAEGKKKILYSVLCGMAVAYSYTVHTRFLVLAGTVFICILLYHLVYRKKLVHYIGFLTAFGISFTFCSKWVQYVQDTLYKTTVEGRIIDGNDALARLGYVGTFLNVFTDFDRTVEFVRYLLSLVGVYTLITGGLIWVAAVVIIWKLFKMWREKDKTSYGKAFFVLAVSGIISFCGMNFLTALNGTVNVEEYKWLTYFRYGRPFVGVLFIIALTWLFKNQLSKVQIGVAYGGILFSLYIVLRFTMRMLENAPIDDVSPVGWMHYYFYWEGETPREYFQKAVIAVFIIGTLLILFLFFKKWFLAMMLFVVFSIALTISENTFNKKIGDNNYEMVDATIDFMEKYEEKIHVPVYFLQGTNAGRLRFGLYDIQMQYLLSEEELEEIDYENSILLSDNHALKEGRTVKNRPKYRVVLDEHEYIYTSNEKIYEMITEEK